jgi:putative flippase GtrA
VLRRQVPLYIVIGFIQLLLDAALFIFLTAFGAPVPAANIASRASAALFGFALNGRYTFASQGQPWRVTRSLLRFVATWCVLTTIGTLVLSTVDSRASLPYAWAAKPLVDVLLATVGFFASRRWIYR